jgi:hypothetical protein
MHFRAIAMQDWFELSNRSLPVNDKIVVIGNPVIENYTGGWISVSEQLWSVLLLFKPCQGLPSAFSHSVPMCAGNERLEQSERRWRPFDGFRAVNKSVESVSDPSHRDAQAR